MVRRYVSEPGSEELRAAMGRERWLTSRITSLAVATRLRSLDAIHLASAMVAAAGDPVFATWDARLHVAAGERGYALLPERL